MGASRTKVRGSQTIRHCRSMCGSNFSGHVACFVGLCHLHFLAVACAQMDLLVTMHLMLCVLRLTTIPKCQAPWTRKTAMKALRALGAVRPPARHRRQHGWTCPQLPRHRSTPLSTLTTPVVCARLNMPATMLPA